MPSSLRRRAIHLAIGVPAVFTSWALLVGLPLAPRPSTPGHLVARTIKLTGRQSASRTKSDRAAADGQPRCRFRPARNR